MDNTLPCITLETGNNPTSGMIWLHGLGADAGDFVPVAEALALPVAMRHVFPDAPQRPVTINGGQVMRAWYDILIGADATQLSSSIGRREDEAGIRAAQAEIEKLIALEIRRGTPARNLFLAGFSQGGAVVLHTGLRHAQQLGGIVALSTYLPLAHTLRAEISTARTPLFMAHGTQDSVLPHALGRASAQRIEQTGRQLDWHSYDMPHAVCPQEIGDIERWLKTRIAA